MELINYLIVGKDFNQAKRFADDNQLKIEQWFYAKGKQDFKDGPTIIILNGWKKKRCLLQQAMLKASLAWGKNPTLYMAETERLWEDV